MRIVFMGTPTFATPALSALADRIVLVVTRPDKPTGRGRKLAPPPVKVLAQRLGLRIHQPPSLASSETLERLRAAEPDLIITAAYGARLSKTILGLPSQGGINVHASLLPKYRGAAPITWAIIKGETKTGITIFKLVEEMDAGPVLLQREVEIPPDQTAGELHDVLAGLGARAVVEAVSLIESGRANYVPQNDSLSTKAPSLKKEDGAIDWNLSALELHNFIRGMTPWPGAYTAAQKESCRASQRMIIVRTEPRPEVSSEETAGTIIQADESGLLVSAGQNCILIKSIKPAGRREMSVAEYLRGHPLCPGDRFVTLLNQP